MKSKSVLIILSVAFGVARLFVHPHNLHGEELIVNIYKDMAHVFLGVLGTLAWNGDKLCVWLFWLLCVLEVAVAFISRM